MKRIIGLGNALVDLLIKIENDAILEQHNLPKGSMQLVDAQQSQELLDATNHYSQTIVAGGSAANTINGLANMGIEVGFIGKIGSDSWGDHFIYDQENNGIKSFLLKSENPSGKALAFISPDSERTFATYLGASIELCSKDLSPLFFEDYDLMHVEGYLVQNRDLLEHAFKLAKKAGLEISLDLASYNIVEENIDFLKEMVSKYVNIVFANEEEAKAFTQEESGKALHKIKESCNIAVIKMGAKGAWALSNKNKVYAPTTLKNAIDTTGAGDLYAAGFLFGYAHGHELEFCTMAGNLLAGTVIENIGSKITHEQWLKIKEKINELEK